MKGLLNLPSITPLPILPLFPPVPQSQGGRQYQEDRLVAKHFSSCGLATGLMGVFDGHGGARTAEEAAAWFSVEMEGLVKPGKTLEDIKSGERWWAAGGVL